MRDAFVVLVSLCIGLVSGLIVPSSAPEHISEANASTKRSPIIETKSTPVPSKIFVLPKNRSDIDEKDLYEHATVKQNNQNERAFILINQKFKKPVRNKVFKVATSDSFEILHSGGTQSAPSTIAPQKPVPSFFEAGYANTYYQGYDVSNKDRHDIHSYYAAPPAPACEKKKNYKENEHVRKLSQSSNRADERRDYFELLKPPILPVSRVHSKTNYEGNAHSEFSIHPPSSNTYRDHFLKKYNSKNHYSANSNTGEERPNDLRKNFGFDRPYIHHPIFRKKEVFQRTDDSNFDGGFVGEDDSHKLLDSNQEDDKLLDKYLKDTLEEQGTGNEKPNNNNQLDCSYRDCVLQTSRQYSHNGLLIKPECKCGRRLNLNPFIAKDRSLREEGHRNDTIPKSSEMNYYEELLKEDASNNKMEDSVIRPPSRYNGTLRH